MARDPNELKYPESPKDDPADLKKLPKPTGIPDAALYSGNYYAIVKVYQNGRRTVEWYKRNTGTPGASTPDDPIQATSEDVLPSVKEEWDKGDQKEDDSSKPPGGIPSKAINGQVFQWNPQTRAYDTPTDQPVAAGTQRPANATPRVEGTPTGQTDANGQPVFDNSKPIMVWRTPDNKQAGPAEPLTEGQRAQWEREKNQGAGVGSYTDTQIAEQARQPAKPAAPKGDIQTIGGRVKEFNPATGKYDIDHGPSTATGEGGVALVKTPVEGRPGWMQITTKEAKDGNSVQVTYYLDPQGNRQETLPGQETTAEVSEPLEGSPGWRVTKRAKKDANGNSVTTTVYLDPQGKEQPSPPPDNKFVRVEFDKDQGKWFGLTKDNKWVAMEGGPGATTTAGGNPGPPLPRIVVGMSVGALTGYKEQLQAEVAAGRQTQAWANARWEEATQLANHAVQESTLLQREYETNLSTTYNIANAKLNASEQGLTRAMNFALSINDKLPPNSPLGGKAFAAMLGLNAINIQRSGINDIRVGPVDTRGVVERGRASAGVPPEPPRLSNIGSHEAVDAQRQAAVEQLRAETGVSNTTDAGGAPREYSPASSTVGSGAPPAASPSASLIPGAGTPAVDTGNVGISPDGSAAPVDVNRPLPTAAPPQFADPQTGRFGIPGSFSHGPTPPSSALPSTSGQPNPPGEQIEIVEPTSNRHLVVPAARIGDFVGPGLGWQRVAPSAPVVAPIPSDTGQTPPVAPIPPDTGQTPALVPLGQGAPQPDMAVLANYRQPQQEAQMPTPPQAPPPMSAPEQQQIPVPEQPAVDPNGGGMPLAALRQKLMSTPPWRLSPSDFALAQQYGLEEDAWKTPRVGMAV